MNAEKKRLSRPENKLVVTIPPVRRLSVVRMELQLVAIAIKVEHVRVAIAVSFVYRTIRITLPV